MDYGTVFVALIVALFLICLVSTVQYWNGVNDQYHKKVRNENWLLDKRKRKKFNLFFRKQRPRQNRRQKSRQYDGQSSERQKRPKRQLKERELDRFSFD